MQSPSSSLPPEEGIELARELAANVLHLAFAYGLLEDIHDCAGVCFCRFDPHSFFLSDALEEVVEREEFAAPRRLCRRRCSASP